jgi:hypothetical protein
MNVQHNIITSLDSSVGDFILLVQLAHKHSGIASLPAKNTHKLMLVCGREQLPALTCAEDEHA